MSIQFGRWNFDHAAVDTRYLAKRKSVFGAYTSDARFEFLDSGIAILYDSFHTTKEMHNEKQPLLLDSGVLLTWDGRLDNREDLLHELGYPLPSSASDAAIVGASYRRWQQDCFAKLVGDWALALWNPAECLLLLAKDFSGVRHLYYRLGREYLEWCTVLEGLVFPGEASFNLEEEYLAGWLGAFPHAHLTPYRGVFSVAPSTYVSFRAGRQRSVKFWDFRESHRIRYPSDAGYEEHFKALFAQSVRRRLRADRPVLAELSGGMDSSSIVCVADDLHAAGAPGSSSVNTISYFNDSEPNWNERPYFSAVEQQRGREGWHIDVGAGASLDADFTNQPFAPAPGFAKERTLANRRLTNILLAHEHRVLLSGIGGDEVLGGVPTPLPELCNLLVEGHWFRLVRQAVVWSLKKRKPLLHLLGETLAQFLPSSLRRAGRQESQPSWLEPSFAQRYRSAVAGYDQRYNVFAARPSFQDALLTIEGLRRQLSASALPQCPSYELRYPFLDRDLLEFLYAVPRDQLVRPGERRSLMRRSLSHLLPAVLLERKRKAFVVRRPLQSIPRLWAELESRGGEWESASLGLVNHAALERTVRAVLTDDRIPLMQLLQTLSLERWLRHANDWNLLRLPSGSRHSPCQGHLTVRHSEVHQ